MESKWNFLLFLMFAFIGEKREEYSSIACKRKNEQKKPRRTIVIAYILFIQPWLNGQINK